MAQLEGALLAHKLEGMYGLSFLDYKEEFDGETFIGIRPIDPPKPNGFGILVAKTPRKVEAFFRADSFSRGLLRRMGEASREAKEKFSLLVTQAQAKGLRITAIINSSPLNDLSLLPAEEWQSIEIDCDARLPNSKITVDILNAYAFEVISICMGLILSLLPLEEIDDSPFVQDAGLPEGAQTTVLVNKYERSKVNRTACILHYGAICQACGFNFEDFYGELGREVIEVHHTVPVSEMGGSYRVNPIKDLVPVCGNCHTILHKRSPPYSIEELREIIISQQNPLD